MRNTAATAAAASTATNHGLARALVTTDLLEHCVDHVVVLHFQLRPHAPRQRPLLRVELCTRR